MIIIHLNVFETSSFLRFPYNSKFKLWESLSFPHEKIAKFFIDFDPRSGFFVSGHYIFFEEVFS